MSSIAFPTAPEPGAVSRALPIDWLRRVAPGQAPGSPRWWSAVQALGTPLRGAADEGGVELLFLCRARGPLQTVYIDVDGHTPHPTQGPATMQHLAGTDLWFWPTRLPADWLGSYAFLPVPLAHPPLPASPRERRPWWMALAATVSEGDAFNLSPPVADGWGRPRALLHPRRAEPTLPVPAGHTQIWGWSGGALERPRDVWLHATAGARAASPWVLLLDGQAWARHLHLFPRLDEATAAGTLPAARYLAVDAGDADTRWLELGCHAPFWQAVMGDLLPQAAKRAGIARVGPCVVAGQSLGGLAALYAALHWPQRFPAALSQSGSFWWPEPEQGPRHAQLIEQVHAGLAAAAPLRALLQIGERDPPDMRALSQRMADALGPGRAALQDIAGGHDWACWREALIPGLQQLLARDPDKEPT